MRFESLQVPRTLIAHAKLLWRLYQDPRAPKAFKIGAWLIFLYLLSPIDLIPDFIPVLGQLDDLLVAVVGTKLLILLCPPDLVEEHRRKID